MEGVLSPRRRTVAVNSTQTRRCSLCQNRCRSDSSAVSQGVCANTFSFKEVDDLIKAGQNHFAELARDWCAAPREPMQESPERAAYSGSEFLDTPFRIGLYPLL